MTKGLKKNIRRCITGSLGRYIAILLIIMLGVAFLTGLRLTRPAMSAIETSYVQTTALFDLRLISTLGFDDADVAGVEACDGVVQASGSVNADFIWLQNGEELVYRAHMLTPGINEPSLTAGRMPENGNECLVDANRFTEDMIGQTIQISDCNSQDTQDSFAYTEYTITGLATTPLYMNVERGTTALGNGSLTGFVLIPADGFDTEYFTELYVKCRDDVPLYSAEYDALIDTLTDAVEPAATLSVQTRYDDLVADAQGEIDDGAAELETKTSEAQAELDDAWVQLKDAAAELQDGQAELDDAKRQLDDAKSQLDDAAEQMLPGFSSWQAALDAATAASADGQAQLDSAITTAAAELENSRAQLERLEATYADGMAQWSAGSAQYEENDALWQSGWSAYAASHATYQQSLAALSAAQAQYASDLDAFNAISSTLSPEEAAGRLQILEATRLELENQSADLAAWNEQLIQTESGLTQQRAALDGAKSELDTSAAQLAQLRAGADDGWAQWNAGKAALETQRSRQQAILDDAKAKLADFSAGIRSYESGLASYEDGVQTLEEGQSEYQDGLTEYWDGVQQLETETADAEAKLDDARQELADLDAPELYVLDRSTNTGYVTFDGDSQIVQRLAAVFPIFFFLIAALVCSTTMTRMVDDDRTQIGTLRALGYGRGAILSKYLIYSGSAATIGCLLGYFGGGTLFPLVIWTAYKMLYNIPGFQCVFSLPLFFISLAASLLCSAGTTFLACRHEMRSTPADLIRPKTPSAGKRILLEHITPLWNRLKFLYKVSLRNIFRFKKRMFMMILGIAGCTALVLTGFGIHDSVANIANFQFDDIQKYDISVSCSDPIDDTWLENIQAEYGGEMDTRATALMSSGEVTGNGVTKSVHIVASDDDRITSIIDLHRDGQTVAYPGAGDAVITEKLADMLGVKVGDTVTLALSDEERAQLRITGIAENYVYNYIYLTGETYSNAFDQSFAPKTMLLQVRDGGDEYALAASLSKADGVSSVSVVSDTRKLIANMMQSLNYVVALVLACAGALAFIVLFNLGNINISERVREIATIKVLGFHAREAGSYVFRENFMLSLMGICCGLPLGIALHTFVMSQIKVDLVSFKNEITPLSFALTVVLVLLFTVITDLIMRRKIAAIDMAESLKSVE